MQETKSLKNEVIELKRSMVFTQNNLEEKVNNAEKNMCKVREDLKKSYDNQTDSDYVNDNLADIKNKLIELEDRLRSNNIRIDEISEEVRETWEECERKVQ